MFSGGIERDKWHEMDETLSNIYDGCFCKKGKQLLTVDFFCNKAIS